MKIIAIDPSTQREQWLDYKRTRISATDVPALFGETRWGTPYTLWSRLTGKALPAKKDETDEAKEFGNLSEDMHANWYCRATGRKLERRGFLCQDEEFPWFCCTPDGIVLDKQRGQGVLELKAPTFTAYEWEDGECPNAYKLQVQVQLRMTQLEWGSASAIVQPKRFHVDVDWDSGWQQLMMEEIINFYEHHVRTDIPPEITSSELDTKQLNAIFKPNVGKIAYMPPELVLASLEVESMQESVDYLELEIKGRKNQVRAFGVSEGAEQLLDPNGVVGWTLRQQAGYAVAATFREPTVVLKKIGRKK